MADRRAGAVHRLAEGEFHIPPGLPEEPRENIALSEPKIWQFYRTGFLLFLAAMIIIGSTLSRMAHGNYPFLIAMVIVDFSLATALFGSSYVFWQHQDFKNTTRRVNGTDSP